MWTIWRNHRFFFIDEANTAIRPLVDEINTRIMRGYGATRSDLFATFDRPALSLLPEAPYVSARWSRPCVAPDHHFWIEVSFYLAPFSMIPKAVEARATERIAENFHRGGRVAGHVRGVGFRGGHVHRPGSHA